MGPPAWVRLYKTTDDRRYLDSWIANGGDLGFSLRHERAFIISATAVFRESVKRMEKRFFGVAATVGMGGLARRAALSPEKDSRRKFYEQQFKEMAAKIVHIATV